MKQLAFTQLAVSIYASLKDFPLEGMREAEEELRDKGNEKLIGTFNGTMEEKQVRINSAGKFRRQE
jgi:hypothetical protein